MTLLKNLLPSRETVSSSIPPVDDSGFISVLEDLATVHVIGDDADTFMQGQLTNDIALLESNCQLNAWCNPKGRVIVILKLWRTHTGIWMQFPRALSSAVINRMSMYIMRSHVTLEDRSSEYVTVGIAGRPAKEWLGASLGNLPDPGRSVDSGEIVINSPGGSSERYLVTGTHPVIKDLLEPLPEAIMLCSADTWMQMDILDGIPEIWPETSEKFIPQSLNLDLLDAVSFSKGCYTGQEVVARTHYLGTPKQRMFLAKAVPGATSDETIVPGSKLFLGQGSEQSIGSVVSSVDTGAGYELLVTLKLHARDSACHIQSPDGPEIGLTNPAYLMDS